MCSALSDLLKATVGFLQSLFFSLEQVILKKYLPGVLGVGIFFMGGAFDFYTRTLGIVRDSLGFSSNVHTSAKHAVFSVAIMLWAVIIIL